MLPPRPTMSAFCSTFNSSFEHPYFVARQLATLDRFSNGRGLRSTPFPVSTGTAGRPRTSRAFGSPMRSQVPAPREFTEVLYRLLYESWDEDFYLDDKEKGTLVKPGSWHQVDAHGEFLKSVAR